MAKTPENVAKFNADLAQKLQPIWKKELQEMLELKEADVNTWLSKKSALFIWIDLFDLFP